MCVCKYMCRYNCEAHQYIFINNLSHDHCVFVTCQSCCSLAQRSGVQGPLLQEYVSWRAETEIFEGFFASTPACCRQQRN